MKTIRFGKQHTASQAPFWQPWGAGGCLGRTAIFLLLLLTFLFLLALLRRCDTLPSVTDSGIGLRQPIDYVQPDPGTIGEPADPDWNRPIDGGEDIGLPSPDDNRRPPLDDEPTEPDPDTDGRTEIYPNYLYVILDPDSADRTDECIKTFARQFTASYPAPEHKIAQYNTGTKTLLLQVPSEERKDIIRDIHSKVRGVKFLITTIEVVMCGEQDALTPDDPVFRSATDSWYYDAIQMRQAWTVTRGTPDVTIGIVDSYMDLSHEELRGGRAVHPYSVPKGTADVYPDRGVDAGLFMHGTFVTTLAAGNADNGKGISGIAPKCKYIPVSLGACLNTYYEIEGILYCIYHNADVVNVSLATILEEYAGLPLSEQIEASKTESQSQEKVWDYVFRLAEKHRTTIVWAEGNHKAYSPIDASKRNKNTICVAAVGRDLRKASFTNFGNVPGQQLYYSTVSAPGEEIISAIPGSYDISQGTSFSAPIVTGVVALMKSLDKTLTTQEIITILQQTGKPVSGAPEIGNLIQAHAALLKVKSQKAAKTRQGDTPRADNADNARRTDSSRGRANTRTGNTNTRTGNNAER